MRLSIVASLVILLFACPAKAARFDPPALIESLTQGYGMVAATVVLQTPADNGRVVVHFKIEKTIATPVAGGTWSLAEGAEIDVKLTVGYGADLETFGPQGPVLAAGDHCYLTLRYDPAAHTYSQIDGASSVRIVKSFEPDTIYSIAAIRELSAALPPARWPLARQYLLDPRADMEMRHTCRAILAKQAEAGTPGTERTITIKFLHDQWRAINISQNYWDIEELDRTIQTLDPAPDSDERTDGWLNLIFAPIQGEETSPTGMNTRWNTHLFRLTDLGLQRPDKVVSRIVQGMYDEHRPMQFRVGLACALQKMYQQADGEHKDWEAELQKFYPIAFAAADGWVLRLLPSTITFGEKEPQYSVKRKFVAAPATWDAIHAALARIETAAKESPKDPNATSAVLVLKDAIKSHQP